MMSTEQARIDSADVDSSRVLRRVRHRHCSAVVASVVSTTDGRTVVLLPAHTIAGGAHFGFASSKELNKIPQDAQAYDATTLRAVAADRGGAVLLLSGCPKCRVGVPLAVHDVDPSKAGFVTL